MFRSRLLEPRSQVLPVPPKGRSLPQKIPDKDGFLLHVTLPDLVLFALPVMPPVVTGFVVPPKIMDHELSPGFSVRTVLVIIT